MISRTFLPILLILAAIATFIMYVRPELSEINDVEAEIAKLERARDNADEVESTINRLSEQRANISPEEQQRLGQILPHRDQIDPVLVVKNINDAAIKSGFTISSIMYEFQEVPKKIENGTQIGELVFTFAIAAPYDGFRDFLQQLETSEHLFDVTVTSFSVPSDLHYNYTITLKKYYLQ